MIGFSNANYFDEHRKHFHIQQFDLLKFSLDFYYLCFVWFVDWHKKLIFMQLHSGHYLMFLITNTNNSNNSLTDELNFEHFSCKFFKLRNRINFIWMVYVYWMVKSEMDQLGTAYCSLSLSINEQINHNYHLTLCFSSKIRNTNILRWWFMVI